ncbi:aldehyde dehydrogenase family protein [Acidocella sp.]|uniref:aldehyde dehydrogenase family protein n=1 Tax=Acidocella sp. TaxID=50710 RepID=UPI003CFCBE69
MQAQQILEPAPPTAVEAGLLIDGALRPGVARYEVCNPATGGVVGSAPEATSADLDAAVAAASRAFPGWAAAPDEVRAAACNAFADTLAEHAEELARLITQEQGKPLNGIGSRFELQGAIGWARYTAGLTVPRETLQDDATGKIELLRKPLGVVGSITPWNWPLLITMWHILPALRAGNTVVAKPAPGTPLACLRMAELFSRHLPPGVLNMLSGTDKDGGIGARMAMHPGIKRIVFTGSTATGQKVMRGGAETLKRLTLELGGNDAAILLPDCNPAEIAEGLFWSAFINTGQTCAALKRLYVPAKLHESVCEELGGVVARMKMGNGLEEDSILGPLSNKSQFDIVCRLAEAAKGKGSFITGGEPSEGLFFPATLVAGLKNGDALVDEEQFGPILPVIRYDDLDEAVQAANASPFGLGGSVWSPNLAAARAVASRLECGTVWLNKHGMVQPHAPFGGHKMSGLGVEFGQAGLLENTEMQVIMA